MSVCICPFTIERKLQYMQKTNYVLLFELYAKDKWLNKILF